ncbi:hypothetical protein C8Q80DRAFT_629002 [Daedaleopsis nitida]|nr:hypothetical protein C8Q80DRAFT_629002 [Daedaleopsis nitida]
MFPVRRGGSTSHGAAGAPISRCHSYGTVLLAPNAGTNPLSPIMRTVPSGRAQLHPRYRLLQADSTPLPQTKPQTAERSDWSLQSMRRAAAAAALAAPSWPTEVDCLAQTRGERGGGGEAWGLSVAKVRMRAWPRLLGPRPQDSPSTFRPLTSSSCRLREAGDRQSSLSGFRAAQAPAVVVVTRPAFFRGHWRASLQSTRPASRSSFAFSCLNAGGRRVPAVR